MSGWSDAVRQWFRRPSIGEQVTERDEAVDGRLSALERRQQEIAARLRLLEVAGDPRGIRDDS